MGINLVSKDRDVRYHFCTLFPGGLDNPVFHENLDTVKESFGVEPSIIGVGPAVAIQTTARNAGLEVADNDPFEINETLDAFQYLR